MRISHDPRFMSGASVPKRSIDRVLYVVPYIFTILTYLILASDLIGEGDAWSKRHSKILYQNIFETPSLDGVQ